MSLRAVRHVLLLLAAGCFAPGAAPTAELPPFGTEQLADGVYLFRSGLQRSLFLVSDDGVIVTDPIDARSAAEYRAAVARITREPVRYVVYSHYHWDRIAGGQVFKKDGAHFIAQEQCAERLKVNPNPEVVRPDITFKDRHTVRIGDKSLELYYFGPSHGDCMTVFLVHPSRLLQIGELVEPPRAAFPDNPIVPYVKPHNLRQFFLAVDQLAQAQGVQTIVASSARLTADGQLSAATGPASLIREQAAFWDAIYRAVEIAEEQGNIGTDSFVKLPTIDLTPFKGYDGYKPEDLPIIMRRFVGYYDMGR